nr:4-hydroxy-3-methylbut-2-enyl diphosphate reductase [Bacteroidota bacterium]
MKIDIDPGAGFCFGVKRAIQLAEEALTRDGTLYCLGQVVHNEEEESRLKNLGLQVIDNEFFKTIKGTTVLIRAHGEPPETYKIAGKNNIRLVEGTCPIVLRLQDKIRKSYEEARQHKGQVVIFGKRNHPEVIGLTGQTMDEAIIVDDEKDIEKIDFTKPVCLYAQTTKNKDVFELIKHKISMGTDIKNTHFDANNTICRHVLNRDEKLKGFAKGHDLILFAGGKHSSNGKYLFSLCQAVNNHSHYIGGVKDLNPEWFEGIQSAGITGATSTPEWLLEKIADEVKALTES